MITISRVIVILLALGLSACGTHFAGNYTGNWQGTANNAAITNTNFNMTLSQSGTNVTGVWIATGTQTPVSGTVSGTTSSNTLNATLVVPANETYTGSFVGTLTLTSQNLSGSVSGTSNGGTLTASVNLTQSQ